MFDKPVRIAEKSNLKSLTDTAGWKTIDGQYDASHIVVRPEHKKLSRWEMGNVTAQVGIGATKIISCLTETVNFSSLDLTERPSRLQLAIELYGASQFELTRNAKFITLMTSLESLTPHIEVSDHVQRCLREIKNFLEEKRDNYTRASKEWSEANQLLARLGQLKTQSISSSLRIYISTIVSQSDDMGNAEEIAVRLRQIYDLRSRLLHDGIAERTDVMDALGFLQDFVPKLLTVLFKAEAQSMKVS